jgi:probable addiction module antidote protein
MRHVAEARGMTNVAKGAQLNRVSMYRMLSEQGNPQLSSLSAVSRGRRSVI